MPIGMWFREDLRTVDNTALHKACALSNDGVIAIYVISPEDFTAHDVADIRIDFIIRHLACLTAELETLNIPLRYLYAKKRKEIPALLHAFCESHDIKSLYYNQQYEIDEARRDLLVEKHFSKHQLSAKGFVDEVFFEPGEVLTQKGDFYTVYTPFKNRYIELLKQTPPPMLGKPEKQKALQLKSESIPKLLAQLGNDRVQALWPAGEAHANKILNQFVKDKITDYKKQRDFPAIDATSKLSPYLAIGSVSSRQCLYAASDANRNQLDSGKNGIVTWINELIWREFYKHIAYAFPQVCMNKAFRSETDNFNWDNDPSHFDRWCQGKTGFPLIDAAMRQLTETGWMHNRLRMLVAMFLTKDLLIDWRWGEKYFMQHLIDGDFASNNGGWQWSAGTGTDAAPYFRIFNPVTQSEKFDKDGEFIKHYLPELKPIQDKTIHFPEPKIRDHLGYPEPIVDHATARKTFLERYKKL